MTALTADALRGVENYPRSHFGGIKLAYIKPNTGAEKTVEVFIELIRSGRYSGIPISDMMEEVSTIKKKIEDLYNEDSA